MAAFHALSGRWRVGMSRRYRLNAAPGKPAARTRGRTTLADHLAIHSDEAGHMMYIDRPSRLTLNPDLAAF